MSTTKWSNATVTSEGLSLQAELLNGGGIEFTRVMGADANGDDKIELTIQPTKLGTAKITIPVLLSNIELTEGFTMTQLRFYAKGTGGAPATEILYAVVQDEDGDQIPSASESPGFTADWSYTFQFGNAESMTVSLDPAGLISLSMVGQPNGVAGLDENGAVPITQGGTGATTAQAALSALGAGVRPNLLDNAYFVGGGTGWGVFPVNQRGVAGTVSTPGYFIDRWKLVSGTVQITSAGLVLNGTIAQVLPSSIGSIYTATALTTTGIEMCQYDDVSRTFTVTGTGQTFVFAKLERGVGQTAAYKDANNAWHMLPQQENDYATQLAKCQSELLVFSTNGSYVAYLAYGFANSSTQYRFSIPTPATMKSRPAITYTGNVFIIAHNARITIKSMSAQWQPNQNSINIIAEVESEGVADEFAMLGIGYEDSTLVLQCP